MRAALVAAGAAGLAWFAWRQVQAASAPAEVEQDADPWNLDNLMEEAMPTIDPPAPTEADTAARNVAAFLMAIRHAEGTAGPDGYRTLFGGRLFDGWSDHPRQAKQFTDRAGRTLWTSAAGAYQFMAISPLPSGGSTRVDTWDRIARKVGLSDFTPASQDRAAVELIDEAGALRDVEAGRFAEAVHKVRRIWASMPGAGYSQGERSIDWLASKYSNAGGAFA
jgi:muramidase (phage lysozyme)